MQAAEISSVSRSHSEASALSEAKLGGIISIAGAVTMLVGAALWASTGTNLDAALQDGTMGAFLLETAEHESTLSANLGFWMLGAVLMAGGGVFLSRLPAQRGTIAMLGALSFVAGATLALGSFTLWLGLVRGIAPAHAAGTDLSAVGAAIGEAATLSDWIATALIVGLGPCLASVAGRGRWVPRWLFIWGCASLALGLLTLLLYAIGQITSPLAVLIVPVGIGWMIAAGIVALRYTGESASPAPR